MTTEARLFGLVWFLVGVSTGLWLAVGPLVPVHGTLDAVGCAAAGVALVVSLTMAVRQARRRRRTP